MGVSIGEGMAETTKSKKQMTALFGAGLARSMVVTMKHFIAKKLTVQYPHQRMLIPNRSRGGIIMKGAIDLKEPAVPVSGEMPPCQSACPANVDARGYVGLIAQGRYDDAYQLHLEKNPIPSIIGRICPHPCETACRRSDEDESITICWLKRFMADNISQARKDSIYQLNKDRKNKKVAIVGAGPAGLSIAFYLGKCGYDVTIFDRLPIVGGMLTVGIPPYRLPEEIVEDEVDKLKKLGVEVKLNTPIGPDGTSLEDLTKQGYEAIFLAIGAHRPIELGIDGEGLRGVIPGEAFLARDRLGKDVELGNHVAVIGGGNTAIDCARVALRLGAKDVRIIYRRSRKEMPALDAEIDDADEEGIKFDFLMAPTKVIGSNKVEKLELTRMELGPPDDSGRRRPVPIKSSEFTIDIDTVLPAISRKPETEWLSDAGLDLSQWATIVVDPETGATNKEGIFAAGDAVTGPSIAIEAVGTARIAAQAIDKYLNGSLSEYWNQVFPKSETLKLKYDESEERAHPKKLDPKTRVNNFDEVDKAYAKEVAIQQAERCLSCMTQRCIGCHICETDCPTRAISILTSQNGSRSIDSYKIDYGRCQLCRICIDVCPTMTITHTTEYELADYTRDSVVHDKTRLLQIKRDLSTGQKKKRNDN